MEEIRKLKSRYQNGPDNIGKELIAPCLAHCKRYRRGTGFFSGSALKSYADSLERIIREDVKIEIICSPVINDKNLLSILDSNATEDQKNKTLLAVSESIVLTAVGFGISPENREYRSKLLAYLIASGQLEVRFAIPKNFEVPTEEDNDKNIYHVKNGYFIFENDDVVAFDGSFNESDSGHSYHVDRTQVYRSWVPEDVSRMSDVIGDVDNDWEEKNLFISVYKLSRSTMEKVKALSPASRPSRKITKKTPPRVPQRVEFPSGIWEHKKRAVETFLDKKNGILEMATGTGKTSTALEIVRQLYFLNRISAVVVSTYGNDLLEQWCLEITKWLENAMEKDEVTQNLNLFKYFSKYKDNIKFHNHPNNSIIVVSRDHEKLREILRSDHIDESKTLIIHDEIHGFGSPTLVNNISGLHSRFTYRLGLSATPEREYDEIGTQFISQEVGSVIFEFSVGDAIRQGILCEFDYIPLDFELTQGDRDNLKGVYARRAADARRGNIWRESKLYIELARVKKKAELKPFVFGAYIAKNPSVLKSCIVFVEDSEQGDQICKEIKKHTFRYKTYYQGTGREYLELLDSKEIDCLVACERLNEGIDIRSLQNVILIASPRAKLKTIQRIGRSLRVDPTNAEKRATVIDFVELSPAGEENSEHLSADQERRHWLANTASVRRSANEH